MNKFKFEKKLSKAPMFVQRFLINQYFNLFAKKSKDSVKYKDIINKFHDNSCIFVHIPKTAGISLSKSIFGDQSDTTHLSVRRLRLLFDKNEFNNYYKFTFVRNPWDKLFSCYRYLKNGGDSNYHTNWINNELNNYNDFNSFVEKWVNYKNIYTFSHFLPQSWFIVNSNNEINVDFIGRYENLNKDFQKICSELSIKPDLKYYNKSDKIKLNYKDYYNQKSIDIVYKVYKEDIKRFKYDYK
tara:strand:- start:4753 stop:5475 length:723 start_codon:yes stop_codon:yes gene_type:complete